MSVATVSSPGKSWRGKDAPTLARRGAAAALLVVATWLALDAGWMHAKGWLAQQLLQHAWHRTDRSSEARPPWPWADTYPVARLRVATLGIDQIVLAGDAGRVLAFGPGWAESSARPGGRGSTVISGHRDTHFAFLRALEPGALVELESAQGVHRYRVRSGTIADSRDGAITLARDDTLLLVTCWPFDAIVAGGPLRYVVQADRIVPATPVRVLGRR